MRKGVMLLSMVVVLILVTVVIAIYQYQPTGQFIAPPETQEPVEVTRTLNRIGADDILVTLDVEIRESRKALGIQERVDMPPCSEIYNISNNGTLKFNNVVEWFLVNESMGLDAEKLESKTLSYRIRYEECLGESEPNVTDIVINHTLVSTNKSNFSGTWITIAENGNISGNTSIDDILPPITIRTILLQIEKWVMGEITTEDIVRIINAWVLFFTD